MMHFAQVARQSHRVIVSHQRGNGRRRRRSYSSSSSDADPEQQPPRLVWPADAKPTPYQVLHVDAGRPYEKTNFVRLVKLYHPDMHRSSSSSSSNSSNSSIQDGNNTTTTTTMSPQTRLHRYHLVVAAHQLLSNPAQRRRYDLYKMGWLAHTPSTTHNQSPPPSRAETWQPRTENAADDDDDDDGRPSPLKQVPIYMSNHAFAILVLVLAFGFAIASCERIRRERRRRRGGGLGRLVDIVDGDIVRSLYGAQHLVSGRSKDERILAFLCRRHVTAMGGRQEAKEEEEEEEEEDEVEEHQGGFLPMDEHWEQNMCRH